MSATDLVAAPAGPPAAAASATPTATAGAAAPAGRRPRSPVTREATALMSSTAVASAVNLLFWVVAARLYPTSAVGRASAAISAMTLLAMFAQLNLHSLFVRFLPEAGRHTMRLLTAGYTVMLAATLLLGGGFVALGLGSQFLTGDAAVRVGFVVGVAALAPFIVQDGVLTALGRTMWVPVENLTVSLVKLSLLVILAGGAAAHVDITLAWCLPVLAAVAVVTTAVFRRVGPAQQDAAGATTRLPGRAALGRVAIAENVNHLVGNVIVFLPPLLVLHVLDAHASAYFAVPWLVVSTAQTLLWNIVTSFIVQSTREPAATRDHARRTLTVGAVVVTCATLGLLLTAPLLLATQGPAFAAAGAGLLRVAALSLPCTAVVIFFSAFALLEQRLWRLAGLQTAAAAMFFGGAALLLPRLGITGVGVAYLAVQGALALTLLPGLLQRLRATAP